jgi:hypothetical protein
MSAESCIVVVLASSPGSPIFFNAKKKIGEPGDEAIVVHAFKHIL